MHGVTKPVTFKASIEMTSTGIAALAEIPITFSEWDITNPSISGFVTTQSDGTLEVLLNEQPVLVISPQRVVLRRRHSVAVRR